MKKSILLVEDDPDHAELITEIMLENGSGHVEKEIILMQDGQDAIEYLEDMDANGYVRDVSQIELVLLDLNLPRVNGMDVLKFIKRDQKYSFLPVVILSTSSDQKTIEEAYDNGADSYIVKPIAYDEFARKLMDMEETWLVKYIGCASITECLR